MNDLSTNLKAEDLSALYVSQIFMYNLQIYCILWKKISLWMLSDVVAIYVVHLNHWIMGFEGWMVVLMGLKDGG